MKNLFATRARSRWLSMARAASGVLGCAGCLWLSTLQPVQAQSLAELYRVALQYDAAFQATLAQEQATLARSDQAKAGLLPNVGLGAGTARNHTDLTVGNTGTDRSFNSMQAGINLNQPLYRPANVAAYRQGEHLVEQAQAQVMLAKQDLIVRLTQAYLDVLLAQESLKFIRAQKEAVQAQLEAAQRNFAVGNATIIDTREAQSRFDLVNSQEITAQGDLAVRQSILNQLVGLADVRVWPFNIQTPLPEVPLSQMQEWVDAAQSRHPQVVLAEINRDVAELETRKAQAGHKPTVDLTGSYGYARNPSTVGLNSHQTNASIGVSLNIPLYAGSSIQNRVRETLALEDKSRADLEFVRRQTAQNTRTALYNLTAALAQVKALEAAEQSSQSALDSNQVGYEVGVRINIDVLNAQSQLYQTKRDLAQARYNSLMANLRLRQASGKLSEEDLDKVNALFLDTSAQEPKQP